MHFELRQAYSETMILSLPKLPPNMSGRRRGRSAYQGFILLTPPTAPIDQGVVICSGDPSRSLADSVPFYVNKDFNLEDAKKDDVCIFCLDEHDVRTRDLYTLNMFQDSSVKLTICSHIYHTECLRDFAAKTIGGVNCPLCKKIVIRDRGNCPYGKLSYAVYPPGAHDVSCEGFEEFPAVVLDYEIPSGVQVQGHPNPGEEYAGTRRFSFFPLSPEGEVVLDLMKRCFEQGHTFTVGTSITTGRDNCVVWNGVHHKTRPDGGEPMHGWPDLTYFDRVVDELRQKGICPTAQQEEVLALARQRRFPPLPSPNVVESQDVSPRPVPGVDFTISPPPPLLADWVEQNNNNDGSASAAANENANNTTTSGGAANDTPLYLSSSSAMLARPGLGWDGDAPTTATAPLPSTSAAADAPSDHAMTGGACGDSSDIDMTPSPFFTPALPVSSFETHSMQAAFAAANRGSQLHSRCDHAAPPSHDNMQGGSSGCVSMGSSDSSFVTASSSLTNNHNNGYSNGVPSRTNKHSSSSSASSTSQPPQLPLMHLSGSSTRLAARPTDDSRPRLSFTGSGQIVQQASSSHLSPCVSSARSSAAPPAATRGGLARSTDLHNHHQQGSSMMPPGSIRHSSAALLRPTNGVDSGLAPAPTARTLSAASTGGAALTSSTGSAGLAARQRITKGGVISNGGSADGSAARRLGLNFAKAEAALLKAQQQQQQQQNPISTPSSSSSSAEQATALSACFDYQTGGRPQQQQQLGEQRRSQPQQLNASAAQTHFFRPDADRGGRDNTQD